MRTPPSPCCHRRRAAATAAALTPLPLPRFCLRCHRSSAKLTLPPPPPPPPPPSPCFHRRRCQRHRRREIEWWHCKERREAEVSGRERRGRATHCWDDAPLQCTVEARRWQRLPRPCPPPSRCRCAACCRYCRRAAGKLPLPPLPPPPMTPRCRQAFKLATTSVPRRKIWEEETIPVPFSRAYMRGPWY
jgi:hypothetical protein